MKLNTPKCIGGKDCYSVCNTKGCSKRPFICVYGCQCQQDHKQCDTNVRWKFFNEIFSKKFMQISVQTYNYLQKIDQIYKSIFKQIQISYNQMKSLEYTLGLTPVQRDLFTQLRQNRLYQLNGNLISQIQLKSEGSKITIIDDNIVESSKLIKKQTQVLLKMLSDLTKQKKPEDSKLIKDIQTISPFFKKKIKQYKLLYRASEHNFQASKFWDKCDGKKYTLTILKTQFSNFIGGYTPLAWDKSKDGEWSEDNSMQSFIFSLTNKHKLALIKGSQQLAIGHSISSGPIFGVDLGISDQANQNVNSYARPGYTYNYNNEYAFQTQQSYQKLSGQSSGQYFKIKEWQVYQIEFV